MRFLLEPCNNTLSHIAKCLAVRDRLQVRGHEVFLAVAPSRAHFLDGLGVPHVVLADIQEADGGPSPSFQWFKAARVEACVRAEVDLLQRLRPDVVLGVFRFTGPISAGIVGIPYDSLICGCMTPACMEVLGFAPSEPGAQEQAAAMTFFRQACARIMTPALSALGVEPVEDLWDLLVGRRTFLWDFPEFQPLSSRPGFHHVGPVRWSGWPCPGFEQAALDALPDPVALLSFGTGSVRVAEAERVIEVLYRLGYSVAVATSGPRELSSLLRAGPRLAIFDFLPMEAALSRVALVCCHGGQGLIFDALQQAIPVLVLPFQPEQSQNGRCLERMGCGKRLARGAIFRGAPEVGSAAFLAKPLAELESEIGCFLADPQLPQRLAQASSFIQSYHGATALADMLERG